MPAAAPQIPDADRERLARLGERLRQRRKQQKVSAVAAAEAAGMSRVTLHRIERGEPGVAMAGWVALASALGLVFDLVDPSATAAPPELPSLVRLADHPQLQKLAWQLGGTDALTPQQALDLYERNWRHVDVAGLSSSERDLIRTLAARLGGSRLLV